MKADHVSLAHARLRTPRAAAVAGIVFSILSFLVFGLLMSMSTLREKDAGPG